MRWQANGFRLESSAFRGLSHYVGISMSVALRRIVSLVSALALFASGIASAQVTIHLTTTQQTSCDVTTDASGLRLVAGSTDLVATGVTLSGTGCGGGSGPPSPNNFPLSVLPASPVSGTPFTVSWTVSGATTCSGSADLNGSSTTLSGWSDVTTATSPRTVVASSAGTYTLSLTCSNASGSVTSQPATVVVSQGGGGDLCPVTPRTRALVSDIHYLPEPPAHVRHAVDLTLWDNIWGHLNESDNVIPWPGPNGASPTIATLQKTEYVAAKFHVPAGTLSTLSGFYKNVSYGAGPNLDMSISTACGDFAPAQAGCVVTDVPSNDQGLVYWRMVNPSNFYCQLTPNTDYFLNLQFHDINTTGPGCTGTACKTTSQHNHN